MRVRYRKTTGWGFLLAAAIFVAGTAPAASAALDLADIVGGGDGTGTGGNQGINVDVDSADAGSVANSHAGILDLTDLNTAHAADHSLVDAVFVPDGQGDSGAKDVEVSTTDLTVSGISDGGGNDTYDHLWNGMNDGVSTNLSFDSAIGMHVNKGITFDLDAIEAAHGQEVTGFTGDAAMADNTGTVDYYVIVDGVIEQEVQIDSSPDTAVSMDQTLQSDDQYLTLITAAAGRFQNDHSFFRNPELTVIPEPGSLALAAPAGLLALRRRRRAA